MNDTITIFQTTDFESSSMQTPRYKAWHKLLKKELTKMFKDLGCTDVKISKPNHFDLSGFVTAESGSIYYFSISDFRDRKKTFLFRSANSYKDYSGGMNQWPRFNAESFSSDIKRMLK